MYPSDTPPSPPPGSSGGGPRWGRRRAASQDGAPWIVIVIVAALVAGGAWWWFGYRGAESEVELQPVSPVAATVPDTGTALEPTPPPLDLPPLEESDGVVQRLVGALSSHPRWAEWLVTDALAQRFVASVANVAAGVSPSPQVPFLEPEGEFRVRSTARGEVIDPASYGRYDALTEAFVSFDTGAAVRLYQQLLPLFDEAHRELGFPPGSFGETFAAAVERIVTVEVPGEPPRVGLDVQTYLFENPELEALSPAQKHVLRLGPDNAARVQAKLRTLRQGLEAAGAIPPPPPLNSGSR